MAPNLTPDEVRQLSRLLGKLGDHCHDASRLNGFWQSTDADVDTHEVGCKIALIAGEALELLEAWRLQDPHAPCAKDPRLTHISEEIADVIIRCMDLAAFFRIDLAYAIAVKLEHNSTRPYKHSKRF